MNDQKEKKKILAVDDDKDILEAIKDKLISSGFEAILAHDGQEGLKTALTQHPDLIILDIIMPREDGMSMLQKLREDNWGKNVPVIILTNISESDKLAQALEIGVDEYMIKSDVKLVDIVEKIKKIIGLG